MNTPDTKNDSWNSGDAYEDFMGRWSQLMAPLFLGWLRLPLHLSWLDVGCGTGALSAAVARLQSPSSLVGVDPSEEFLDKARQQLPSAATFFTGNASRLPLSDHSVDAIVSGLAMNFFPDVTAALKEMKRVLRPTGTVAAYVWDYAGRMDFLRLFWDAATETDAAAGSLDEGNRFPICRTDRLTDAFAQAGFADVEATTLDIDSVFSGFDDYWKPFLGGQGPAASYLRSLKDDQREQIRQAVTQKLPVRKDGSIKLLARAIAVRGNTF
jgi:SAM-dependent methyltransferase